jgi:hypothetical protein
VLQGGAICSSAARRRVARSGTVSLRADDTPATEKAPSKPLGKATLQANTTWRISLAISGKPTEEGQGTPVDVSCKAVFIEEEGYEPPQGIIRFEGSNYLGGVRPSWTLAEDPSAEGFDKAGFWIWGLFEEPKYPFMLLEFEVLKEIPLSTGVIPVGKMFGQCKVTRDKETGVSISDGTLSITEMTEMQADLVGLSTAFVPGVSSPCILPTRRQPHGAALNLSAAAAHSFWPDSPPAFRCSPARSAPSRSARLRTRLRAVATQPLQELPAIADRRIDRTDGAGAHHK